MSLQRLNLSSHFSPQSPITLLNLIFAAFLIFCLSPTQVVLASKKCIVLYADLHALTDITTFNTFEYDRNYINKLESVFFPCKAQAFTPYGKTAGKTLKNWLSEVLVDKDLEVKAFFIETHSKPRIIKNPKSNHPNDKYALMSNDAGAKINYNNNEKPKFLNKGEPYLAKDIFLALKGRYAKNAVVGIGGCKLLSVGTPQEKQILAQTTAKNLYLDDGTLFLSETQKTDAFDLITKQSVSNQITWQRKLLVFLGTFPLTQIVSVPAVGISQNYFLNQGYTLTLINGHLQSFTKDTFDHFREQTCFTGPRMSCVTLGNRKGDLPTPGITPLPSSTNSSGR